MPRRQPFTALCQTAARLALPGRIDLHTHTTASDGDFTPSQLVVQACTAGLTAVAVTDHDTTAGLVEARATMLPNRPLEIVSGVEISTVYNDHGYHLLGYFLNEQYGELQRGLAGIRERRRDRFRQFLDAFERDGVSIPEHLVGAYASSEIAVGRRHLAKLLVAAGHANSLQIAFQKYILPQRIPCLHSAPMIDALGWIRAAGGVSSLAHPGSGTTSDLLSELHALGLDAVEANCPSVGYGFGQDLAIWAARNGLLTTGGSDYHGSAHTLGSRTVSATQFAALRERAARSGPTPM